MEKSSGKEVARLQVSAERRFLPSVAAMTRGLGLALGLGEKRAGELEHAVDEAVTNVIQHAFDLEGGGVYTLIVSRWPGQVQVAIEDQGLPFDLESFRTGDRTGLGHLLLRRYADEVRFYNRGAAGKRLEIFKHLPTDRPELFWEDEEREAGGPASASDEPVEIRLLEPGETLALARAAYRAHGYAYAEEQVYYPDQMREMLESQRLVSAVAMTYGGEVAAHAALRLEEPQALAAETGLGLVDPRFRERGLLPQVLALVIEEARQRGLSGLWGLAGCAEPEMQEAALGLGFRETGLLLAAGPGAGEGRRQSGLLYYLTLEPGEERQVFAPPHHGGILRELYRACGLPRRLVAAGSAPALAGGSLLDLKLQPEWGRAVLGVSRCGADLLEQISAELKGLKLRGLPCVYLDLPLHEPALPSLTPQLEMMGFFWAGLLPEAGPQGDVLRLQYLNNAEPEGGPCLVSGLGRRLWDYVAAGR
ncbi:hypothetical protein AAU61_04995 [Desulfocarbo indianensis]|nr:hypothetical protein AAU61_04995 [Desulfocarbo indianensis]